MWAIAPPQHQEDDSADKLGSEVHTSMNLQHVDFKIGEGISGASINDHDSPVDFPYRAISSGTNNENDVAEINSQAEIPSPPTLGRIMTKDKNDSNTENVAEEAESMEPVASGANGNSSTSLSNFERNIKNKWVDENGVESNLADDEDFSD